MTVQYVFGGSSMFLGVPLILKQTKTVVKQASK